MTSNSRDDFSSLVEPHRRELQLHCYRMLGSYEDSEDMVQETLLRAWRRRSSLESPSSLRAWLYRIATNACLDFLKRHRRTPTPDGEVLWLQPFPDRLLEEIASDESEPGDAVVAKETVELAFLVAIQHLPPRQRAVLILRDVLGWSAKETAALLETSQASVTSALQRARATMKKQLPERRTDWPADVDATEAERELLRRYVEATEQAKGGEFIEMMREDARFWMPPEPGIWEGREAIVQAWIEGGFESAPFGDARCTLTRVNMQPAVACYVRRPGDSKYRALAIDVLDLQEGKIAEIITFHPSVFPALGLPETL